MTLSVSEFWAKWESSDRKKRRHAWWWWWIYGPMKGPTFGGLSFVFHFFQSFHKTLVGGICYFAFAGSQYGVVYYSWDLTNIFLYSFFFWIVKSTKIEKESRYWTKLKNGINLEEEFRTIILWSHHFQNNFTMVFCYLQVKKWCQ